MTVLPLPSLRTAGLGVVLAVLIGAPAAGQGLAPAAPDGGTRLVGWISDSSGAPLPGVLVEASSLADATRTRQTLSDGAGRYAVGGLGVGDWRVRYSLPGFVPVVRPVVVAATGDVTAPALELPLSAAASVVVTGRRTFTQLTGITSHDELVGVADTASTGVVTAAELDERARRRPAEALEAVPGMVVSQHSGEGKANQYYLRGFNIDHGTDLSLSVAGMPVNLPTHGHGQGYADLNFLIPELVSGIQYQKGPYAADAGDFSAAGTVRVNYVHRLDGPLVRLEGGTFGYGRALGAVSPRLGDGHLLVAAETVSNDGPWARPDALRKWNGLLRYSRGTATSGLSVTALSYRASWNASDQIPQRAVDARQLSRYGFVDRTSGGETHRTGVVAEWQRTSAAGISRVVAYGFDYGLDLFSNFTYFLDDPERGDQFEQRDARRVVGGRASRTWAGAAFGQATMMTLGVETRHDHVGALGLYRTQARRRLSTVREDAVAQTSGALFGEWRTRWSDHLRTTVGVRGDAYRWQVRSADPENGGGRRAAIATPKVSVALGPWRRSEVYASAGGGFHSNDGRGVTIRRDPLSGEAADRVDPLVAARGAELGVRTRALPRLHTTLAVWSLWLDSELLFVGDAGTTTASRPSRRLGVEWDADWHAASWLDIDASVAYSQARFTDADAAGSRVPGAVEGVASAGAVISPPGPWSGTLRWRYFGPRPLVEDDSVRSRPSHLVSAEVGRQLTRTWRLKADILNVLNAVSSDVDYFYTSRLPGEAPGGVQDVHQHPVEPISLRVALVARF